MTDENIILVTVDSLRADHCGFMGYEGGTTPTLDEMASEGIAFTNAIAPGPRTPESMPPTFTGCFLSEDLPSEKADQQSVIREHMSKRTTIAEQFSNAGYRTVGVTPNPFTSKYFGFDQGFDEFVDFIGEDDSIYGRLFDAWIDGNTSSNVLRLARNMILREEVFKPWEVYYSKVKETVRGEEPYFLWVFLMDVHEPYLARKGYRSQGWLDRWRGIWSLYLGDRETEFDQATRERLLTAYDDSIRYADVFLKRLLSDISDNTIVAVHGDHGEAFGEHGYYSHEPYLYEESIHVPLVIHGAGEGMVQRPTSLLDLPSILTSLSQTTEFNGTDVVEARTANRDTVALRA
ncbi:MAG: sulfatase, partial [Halobacteriaceae archaeon]